MDKATFIYKLYIFIIIVVAGFLIYLLFDKAIKEYLTQPSTLPITTTTEKITTTTEFIRTTEYPITTTTTTTVPVTTTTVKTTKQTVKTTKQKVTTQSTEPLALGLKIGFNGFNLYGEIAYVRGGLEPYSTVVSIYKNGELLNTVNDLTYVEKYVDPFESAVYKVYGKVIDANGESIEGEKEKRMN